MNKRYRLLRLLSRRVGMEVLEVFDETAQTKCIAKHLSPKAHSHLQHQHRQEIRILSSLSSPWIPSVLDVFEDEEGSWLIESKIEGQPLNEWLAKKPPRAARREVYLQITALCHLLHQLGYVHMDLSENNILIRSGHACLIDFNACVPVGSTQILMADQKSLPPEAKEGQPAGIGFDIYALGHLHRKMLGLSWISHKCLCAGKKRYGSISQLRHACQRQSALSALSAWVLLIPACSSAMSVMASQLEPKKVAAISQKQPADKEESDCLQGQDEQSQTEQKPLITNAAKLCQQLSDDSCQSWSSEQWHQCMRTALEEKHALLAKAVSARIPQKLKKEYPALWLEILHLSNASADLSVFEQALDQALNSLPALLKQDQEAAESLLDCIREILMDKTELWNEKTASALSKSAANAESWNEESALSFMELVLEAGSCGYEVQISQKLDEALQKSSEGKAMLSVYKRSKEWKTS